MRGTGRLVGAIIMTFLAGRAYRHQTVTSNFATATGEAGGNWTIHGCCIGNRLDIEDIGILVVMPQRLW